MREARGLLRKQRYSPRASTEDFVRWLHTDTPYPNPSFDEIVAKPYYVVHELVEVEEAKRMSLRLTKDVIVKHMKRVNDAHLVASRAEFIAALRAGDRKHLTMRYRDLEAWCRDPLLTPLQKRRYEAFRRWARKQIRNAGPQARRRANR